MGGFIYLTMLMMATFVLLANFDVVGDSSVPMLSLIDHINHPLSYVMVVLIFIMIYNTCIGMFYALGRRLTANPRAPDRTVLLPGGLRCELLRLRSLDGQCVSDHRLGGAVDDRGARRLVDQVPRAHPARG